MLLNPINFWTRHEKLPNGCWLWMGHKDRHGYGRAKLVGASSMFAHIIAYTEIRGHIPEGLELDHLCGNPACINPFHLEAVTHRVNVRRGNGPSGINARKTHCINGHEFTISNTKAYGGKRQCAICVRVRNKKAQLAQRERRISARAANA